MMPARSLVALLGLLALAPAAGAWQEARPQDALVPPARDTSREQEMLDELRAQAREDLAVWEARVKARQSWVREASLRADTAKSWRDAIDKRVKQGYETAGTLRQNELELAELEARRDQKIVELKEAETRVSRLKRRLAALQKADKYDVPGQGADPGSPFAANAIEERFLDLEQQLERLRAEMDETRQTARELRHWKENLQISPQTGKANTGKEKQGTASVR